MRERAYAGVGVAVVVLVIWYWFIDEQEDSFAPPKSAEILADPKMPPDPDADVKLELQKRTTPERADLPIPESSTDCPPGDPMCGGL